MARKSYSFRQSLFLLASLISFTTFVFGVAKPHVIAFGKWTSVQFSGDGEEKTVTQKVRPLLVDTRVKEFTFGPAHDITERLFVVRRTFRVNDSLPQESPAVPHWQWERGGWLLVDRATGHISAINLPEFDADYSTVTWYRDYAAYCGISDDGKKIDAIVAQVSRRKPVLRQKVEEKHGADLTHPSISPDSRCEVRAWERSPVRVTFDLPGSSKETFVVRGHVVDLVSEEEDNEEAAK